MYQNVNARAELLFLLIKRIVLRRSCCRCHQERMKAAGSFFRGKRPWGPGLRRNGACDMKFGAMQQAETAGKRVWQRSLPAVSPQN